MSRLLVSSLVSASRCSARNTTRRHASTSASSEQKSSNIATIFLGIGVLSAGGYYALSRSSPQTIKKAEQAVENATGLAAGAAESVAGALDSKAFKTFKLKEVLPYNHNTSQFVFELPDGVPSGLSVASAVLLKPAVEGEGLDDKGKPAIRPYTPISRVDDKGHIDFLIKKYPNGKLTQYIHSLKPGQEIAIKGPLPKHPWKANEFEHIGMICGGTGVTPHWQIIQAIADNPADKTKVTMLFANVTEKDILLKEQFDKLSKAKPEQFNIMHVIEKPEGKNYKGEKGYIKYETLAKNLPMPGLGNKIKIFICGPPPMVEAISGNKVSPKDQGPLKGLLADLGYSESQVYKF